MYFLCGVYSLHLYLKPSATSKLARGELGVVVRIHSAWVSCLSVKFLKKPVSDWYLWPPIITFSPPVTVGSGCAEYLNGWNLAVIVATLNLVIFV